MRVRSNLAIGVAAAISLSGAAAGAEPLSGTKTIALVDAANAKTVIGEVVFTPDGESGRAAYEISWRESAFADHFLSMRPFECLEGPAKHWCRVPYPYEIGRSVAADDLTDLEYDLLFLWKGASEYGINMWNGVYYKLSIEEERLVGRLHEMDMNVLSAPPEKGDLRPVREADLEEGDPDSHWLARVVIE